MTMRPGDAAPGPSSQWPAARLSPLLHDRNVQAVLWQIAVVSIVIAIGVFLVANTLHNLETRHIKTGYDFLEREAGFQIGESLIGYSPASSYARALEVGFLNTIHVAFLGIVLATVLGVLVGIATLSGNWLVARLAGGYIHFLRNIPVLLQIILWYTILISDRFLPGPRQASSVLGVYFTQRGIYFPVPAWSPEWNYALIGLAVGLSFLIALMRSPARTPNNAGLLTRRILGYVAILMLVVAAPLVLRLLLIPLSWGIDALQELLVSIDIGVSWLATFGSFAGYLVARAADVVGLAWPVALGALAGSFCAHIAQRRQDVTGRRPPLPVIGTTVALGLTLAGWLAAGAPTAISWPGLSGFNIAGGSRITPEFAAVLFGLTVYTSAFIAEIVRSGILAVPRGQTEAARALGMNEAKILRLVTLPQALRVIIPPLTSQYLNLTKNSSLSVAIGYPDLVNVANTTMNQTGQAIEAISIIMLVYLATSLATSAFMNWYNKKIALVDR
ncbi:MAG: amino acid ABC transporter permease [Hyphomicrobiaceae bacterium]